MKKRNRTRVAKDINFLSWQKILIPFLTIEALIFFLSFSIASHFIQNQTNIQPISSVISIPRIFFLLVSNLIRYNLQYLLPIIALFTCSLIFVLLFFLKALSKKQIPIIKRVGLIVISFSLILGAIVTSSSSIILVILQLHQKAQKEVRSLETKVINRQKETVDGIVFDYKIISKLIQDEREIPQFILSRDLIPQRLLFALLGKRKNNFYYGVLVRNNIFKDTRPDSSFSKEIAKDETILFPDFALFVNTKDFEKLTDLGYSIGNVMIRSKYNELLNNKLSDMNFSLLTQEEYIREIKREQEKIKETFENQIAIERNNIQKIQIYIDQISIDIADIDRRYSNAANDAFLFYSSCIESVFGYYNPEFCSFKKNELDVGNRKLLEYKEKLEYQLLETKNLLNHRLLVLDSWESAYKEFLGSPRDPYSELGSFNPPSSVLVTIQTGKNEQFDQYILTVVHEFLHYSSYKNGHYFDNQFFEESTTEYLARKMVKDAFKKETYSGSYELAVQTFKELLKKLPEEKLENLYFKKDQEGVIALIDKQYGKGTYNRISSDLILLLYASPFNEKAQELKEKILSKFK